MELLHQNLAMQVVKLLHTFFVSRNTLMLNVGMACAMDLIRVSLPAHANNLSDHPCMQLLDLSLICSNVPLVILPTAVGRPR